MLELVGNGKLHKEEEEDKEEDNDEEDDKEGKKLNYLRNRNYRLSKQ